MPLSNSSPRRPSWRTVLIVVLSAFGTMAGLQMFFEVRPAERQPHLQTEFYQRATAGATAIQRTIQEHLEVLYHLGTVYAAAARPLTREEFRDFTKGPLQRYAGVQALGWIPRIPSAELESYLAAALQDGITDFRLVERTPRRHVLPAARRDVYYPIFYLESLEGHGGALGLNLSGDPTYMDAMQKALNTTGVVASAWLTLTQDSLEHFGVLLFLPIYQSGQPHSTLEERRTHLQGFVMALLRLGPLITTSLQSVAIGTLGVQLADVTDAVSGYSLLLQFHASRVSTWTFLPRQHTQTEAIRAGSHSEVTFNVAGRTWSVLFYPLSEARLAPTWLAGVVS